MPLSAALDTNVVVALLDSRDSLHRQARSLDPLFDRLDVVHFDFVFAEALSVVGRRLNEQGRQEEVRRAFETLVDMLPPGSLTGAWPAVPRLMPQILETCKASLGKLNFNDSLLVAICQELGIRHILSFDRDFDGLPALSRLSTPEGLEALLAEAESNQAPPNP